MKSPLRMDAACLPFPCDMQRASRRQLGVAVAYLALTSGSATLWCVGQWDTAESASLRGSIMIACLWSAVGTAGAILGLRLAVHRATSSLRPTPPPPDRLAILAQHIRNLDLLRRVASLGAIDWHLCCALSLAHLVFCLLDLVTW